MRKVSRKDDKYRREGTKERTRMSGEGGEKTYDVR